MPSPLELELEAEEHESIARGYRAAAKTLRLEENTVKVRAFYEYGGAGLTAILGGGYKLRAPRPTRIGARFTDPVTGKTAQVHAIGWGDE